ncbi:hypothetical protein ABBQ32_001411 [Trebouxia sp. C0010 RCD-2024]
MEEPSAQKSNVKSDELLQRIIATVCSWILQKLASLQDELLSFTIFRKAAAYGLAPKCQHIVLQAIQTPDKISNSFEDLDYYVSEDAQELLMHAALHAFANTGAQQLSAQLPSLGRILLQIPIKDSSLYQESVAAALAKHLNADFLVVDDVLLSSVAKAAFGSSIDKSEHHEDLGKFAHFVLSIWFSGGKFAFVWDIVQRTCYSLTRPLVLFIKDAEHTICDSFEREVAFQEAFGMEASSAVTSGEAQHTAAVLVAGCSLGDTGADIAPHTPLAAKHADEGGAAAPPPPSGSTPAGHDDGLGPILPDLGSLLHADKPNARRILSKLFTTRVKLAAAPEGPAAARHNARIARDADKILASDNHTVLKTLASAAGVVPPEASSAIYFKKHLSVRDWTKVLAWARSIQAIDTKASAAKSQEANVPSTLVAKAETTDSRTQPSESTKQLAIRRSQSAVSSANMSLESLPLLHEPPVHEQPASHQSKDLALHSKGSSSEVSKQDLDSASADAVGRKSPQAYPYADGVTGDTSEQQGVQLSEGAIWYGLHMLERAGGTMRQHIATENMYEQRLLPEVVKSDEAGAGFAEVGALSDAKDALREAVQLPLQHPRLFQKGSLARPCRGVLLFGPPGTGKTLLARAAAAECGASFLAIHPSTVASKWLGDGVRYMRAVFSLASKLSPCVLFIDEVDAMLAKRDSQREHEAHRELKNEFTAQWDGIRTGSSSSIDRVMVLGATNRPQDLDEAVLRRFSRRIFCDLPNRQARQQILDVILSGEAVAKDVSTAKLAEKTEGFSGSDLRQLCTAAAMCGIRELMKATSQASKDKAAAKKAKRTRASLGSSKSGGAGTDPRAGPDQQQDKAQSGTATGDHEQSMPPREATGSAVVDTVAHTPLVSSAGTAADGAKQTKQGIGSKRDIAEDSSSSTTKRLKASTDSVEGAEDTSTQGASAACTEIQQHGTAGTTNGAAASTRVDSPTGTDAVQSTSTGQEMGHHQKQHAEASTQSMRQSVDWLLSKYREVAAAADQQVCNC